MRLISAVVVLVSLLSSSVLAVPPDAPELRYNRPTIFSQNGSFSFSYRGDVTGVNIYLDDEYVDTKFAWQANADPDQWLIPSQVGWCTAYITAFNRNLEYSGRSNEVMNTAINACGGQSTDVTPTTPVTPTPEETTGELCIETIVRRNGVEIDQYVRCY